MSELCSTFSTKIIRKKRIQLLTNLEKALKAPQSLPHTFYCSSPRCQREFGSPLSELSLSVIIEIIIKLNSYLDWNRWMELFSTRLKKIKIVKKSYTFDCSRVGRGEWEASWSIWFSVASLLGQGADRLPRYSPVHSESPGDTRDTWGSFLHQHHLLRSINTLFLHLLKFPLLDYSSFGTFAFKKRTKCFWLLWKRDNRTAMEHDLMTHWKSFLHINIKYIKI